MRTDDLRGLPIFGGLDDEQLGSLLAAGSEVEIQPGEELFREGEHADDWWVLVDGALELVRHIGREDVVVGRMDEPGRWAGGFRAWDEHGVYLATARGVERGRLLRVPAGELRELTHTWLPMAEHLIAGLYGTARSIESTARQRGALVTLGTLAAGLAHEINNPAAAAARAADDLTSVSGRLLTSLGSMAGRGMTPEQFSSLDRLRQEVDAPTTLQDPLEAADREEELADWLVEHGVEQPWDVASDLAAAGVGRDWCDRAAAELGPDVLGPSLRWVASTIRATTLLSEVRESTRRVSELVAAIKSYSQMDRGSLQSVDVRQGIESTLVILAPKLRGGVVVERELGDIPPIAAYEGELNQVWTNLVDNAVDAMEGSGTLRVSTRRDGDAVVVEVADTGEGMPPEVVERAFEAFYTTKPVGKGTGLGLDIARRIVVDRHGGAIEVDSEPGRTVLRVRLPIRHP
ncbi:cyclic nucleotide-binding protein [Humibacillus xanthopallidus]|uniref:histidine kinase n=1 Tax=Humibacillus xanthopallidus TaxID=412689 RepID=A0A543PVH7_9MICO|nr:ATP-binding protein [Humibacillus xanthopallidus]TQN48082.1 cyclic nucleotide-binding protein [Humibacillus xanthopallidus]